MRLSAEELSQPLSDDLPCGEDLEYDPAFQAMESALQSKPEQEFGDTIIPAEEPDWKTVEKHGEDLLKRTRDLRVLANVAIAQLHTTGFGAFRDALQALNACMETFWDQIYPELDVDDNNDATMRYNVLQVLNDHTLVAEGLKRAPLIVVKGLGAFSLRSIELAEGKTKPLKDEEVYEMSVIQGALGDASTEEMTALGEAVRDSEFQLRKCTQLWDQLAENSYSLTIDDTLKGLVHIQEALSNYAPVAAAAIIDDEGSETDEEGPAEVKRGSGVINDRNDVVKAIDKICEYYANNEPSSPVPLLLKRAQRLVPKSFFEILEDLSPDGVAQAKTISGNTE